MALLFISAVDDPADWSRALKAHAPDLDIRVWPETGAPEEIRWALVWRPPAGVLARFPNLELIQSLGAGVDHVFADPDLPAGVPVARLIDPALTGQMVEYAVLAVLHHHRRMDDYRALQARSTWRQLPPADTGARRVGVMGLGEIGGAAARALAGFGFAVAGWSRSARTIEGIEGFHGPDGLAPFLARTDVLVCLLPLTRETEDILDARAFAALPRDAYVVNAARGRTLVESDLIAAIDAGHLSGAWLDVFRDEPLPPENPLWRHPRITVTPHIAGWVLAETSGPQVVENIRRVSAGRPPLHPVEPARGY